MDEEWEWYITAMSVYCFGYNLASVQNVSTQADEEWEWGLIAMWLIETFKQFEANDDDRFYIALFSALEQTHCARMWFYMSV